MDATRCLAPMVISRTRRCVRVITKIGYSGIGYTTSSVRAVPLAKEAGREFVSANPENAISGSYPLSRFLYVYINKAPGKPLPPLTAEFIKMVLSRAGQEVVVKDGYFKEYYQRITRQEGKDR